MKIRSVEFVTSVAEPTGDIPRDLPHVAFSGRSNVGKSSLINRVLERHNAKIARVSARPGKTRTLNFFKVNERFYVVDLPGFGYAEVPGHVRDAWKELIEGYVEDQMRPGGGSGGSSRSGSLRPGDAKRRAPLRGMVHLVDARHDPTALDREMMTYLSGVGIPVLVVLTKMDKLSRSKRSGVVDAAADLLGVGKEQVLPFSAKTGEGRSELMAALDVLLEDEE